jgi:hypothetical protein
MFKKKDPRNVTRTDFSDYTLEAPQEVIAKTTTKAT